MNKKSPAEEIDRAYLIVNLALSFLLNDKLEEKERRKGIEEALARRSWSIVDSRFAMALCCINEDYENFGELFDSVVDRDFQIDEFMGYAIFAKARNKPIFREKMLEHYGVEVDSSGIEEGVMRKED